MRDLWRDQNPEVIQYSYWDARHRIIDRKANGWRIDYVLVSESLIKDVSEVRIRDDVFGSDHCPLEITIKV